MFSKKFKCHLIFIVQYILIKIDSDHVFHIYLAMSYMPIQSYLVVSEIYAFQGCMSTIDHGQELLFLHRILLDVEFTQQY